MTLIIWLVNRTQVAIDPLKVHHALDAKYPGTVFCGMFDRSTKPGVKCCGRGGERGRGVTGGRGNRGWCSTGDWSYTGRGGEGRVRTG